MSDSTEPSEEQPKDPATLAHFPRLGSDGRQAERLPEPFGEAMDAWPAETTFDRQHNA